MRLAPARPGPRTPWLLVLAIAVGFGTAGCQRFLPGDKADVATLPVPPAAGPAASPDADRPDAVPVATLVVVTGRLVDADTGLPVKDAGITCLGVDRRTISAADGGFRFDDVPAGSLELVVESADGYVSRGWQGFIDIGASEVGAIGLVARNRDVLVPPEGGVVAGCPGTSVTLPGQALSEAAPVHVTCLERERQLPAAAPAGRLPLAALEVHPPSLVPLVPARLRVALPPQPRYGAGVALELLRLDLDRLAWMPGGRLEVEPGGDAAGGDLGAFGIYLVASPPFGTFSTAASEPTITQFRLSLTADGPPVASVAAGLRPVFAVFEYAGLDGTTVTVRVSDASGRTCFEAASEHSDRGRAAVPMVHGPSGWPVGHYTAAIWIGDRTEPAHRVTWSAADAAAVTQTVPPASPPPVRPTPAPLPSESRGCRPPAGWFAYVVAPGDTLGDLAASTGVSVTDLARANCLTRETLFAGELLYLPRPPSRRSHEAPAPAVPTQQPGPSPWYPAPTYRPEAPKPSPLPATAAPRPTAPPPASPPPTQAPLPAASPTTQQQAPTAKWPTLPPEIP